MISQTEYDVYDVRSRQKEKGTECVTLLSVSVLGWCYLISLPMQDMERAAGERMACGWLGRLAEPIHRSPGPSDSPPPYRRIVHVVGLYTSNGRQECRKLGIRNNLGNALCHRIFWQEILEVEDPEGRGAALSLAVAAAADGKRSWRYRESPVLPGV